MNLKRETVKNIFLAGWIIFTVLTFAGAIAVISGKADNAGYACIPMLFGIIFGAMYRKSKKAVKENKE